MTLSEALIKAEDLKKDKKASDIIELLTPFWKEKITTNVGALLAYAYRRNGAYDTCLQICDAVDKASNFPAKIKAQRQWCYIFRDIIHEESFDVAEAQAIKTITLLNVNSSYDFGVFKFICLARAKKNDLDAAIEWFERIPSNKLSNRTHSYTDEETGWVSRGISEKHSFYVRLIDRLKTEENIIYYINKLLSNFSNNNKTSFIEAIRKSISIINYKNEKSIRVKKLAGILMHIKESGHCIKTTIVKVTDSLRMSDVAAYVFCPISAIISKTLSITELSIEYNESISYSKKFINDYYEIVRNKQEPWIKVLNEFTSIDFKFSDVQQGVLSRIFKAHRVALNSQVGGVHMSNIFKGTDIFFSPDMILQDGVGKFCVEEVFTSKLISSLSSPYENDKVKLIGYLKELNISVGYLMYWNITYSEDDYRKRAQITGLKIFEVKLNESDSNSYLEYKSKLKKLISDGSQPTPYINFNKCISCSVMHYCIHKMGHSAILLYPYKSNYIK